MADAARPRRRGDVLSEVLPDGSGVLFDPLVQMAYPITASAVIVWGACDGAHTAPEIVDEVGALFEAPPDVIGRDVERLLRHLSEIRLLEPTQGPEA